MRYPHCTLLDRPLTVLSHFHLEAPASMRRMVAFYSHWRSHILLSPGALTHSWQNDSTLMKQHVLADWVDFAIASWQARRAYKACDVQSLVPGDVLSETIDAQKKSEN